MPTANTFEITATAGGLDVTATFRSAAMRDRVASDFPRSAGLRPSSVGAWPGYLDGKDWRDGSRESESFPTLRMHARLLADRTNGGINETGLRRTRSFLRAAAKWGYEVVYRASYTNSLTQAEFEELVGERVP